MTSLNTYFDAIKPFAKSLQEKATKLTDVLDEKLKKTQENLEKHRTKVNEAAESEALPRLWRPSNDDPLGQLIVMPAPIPIPKPVIPVLEDQPKSFDVNIEAPTIKRKKSQKTRRSNDVETENERKHIIQCLNDIINQIVEKEDIEKSSEQLIEDFIENNSLSTESQSLESITTTEDNSDLSESHSNTIETDLFGSINHIDTASEKSDRGETIVNTDFPEEPTADTNIEQSDTYESSESSEPIIEDIVTPQIDELPEEPIPTKIVKKEKRFPIFNCYSLPTDVTVVQMTCSSTHVYICTDKYSLFYAKIPEDNQDELLQWYRYTLPAQRIVVSNSNQTIWRIFEKTIYLSSDTIKLTPLGILWTELTLCKGETLLSVSITDEYGWFIKQDGSLWFVKMTDDDYHPLNVACPFELNHVVCSTDKLGIITNDGQIIIRIGCTNDCPEGDGWIFIEHNFGPFDDFTLIKDHNIICVIDKKQRIWLQDWSSDGKVYEILCDDDYLLKATNTQYLIDISDKYLCFTDCEEQLYIFSNCLTGIHWSLMQKNTRLQRLTAVMPNEDHVWALTTDGVICSSNGQTLDKPRQAQYLTHASFVPDTTNTNKILWSLDDSCNIYIRDNLNENSQWEQLDQSQFEWNRRLVGIVCNTVGVWAVDDEGCVYFRYGHISNSNEYSVLNAAWIQIPGEPLHNRLFVQIFCGPEPWMVYATDNKQDVYARIGIDEKNCIGTTWELVEDCSALELAISEHTLWLVTSHGRIQCRENISLTNPIGTRTVTLPGRFNSLTVSTDDDQIWALYPQHHLFKLDRVNVLL